MGDQVRQTAPHCHAAIHPPVPPTPVAHPALPLAIVEGVATVRIGRQPAAVVGGKTAPCALPACTPSGPGVLLKGSATVRIGGRPAVRVGDETAHASCVAPIPSPTGKVLPPGCPTVRIGG
jgi:uncharacterized Zn-binding protein involved in type VI secretion